MSYEYYVSEIITQKMLQEALQHHRVSYHDCVFKNLNIAERYLRGWRFQDCVFINCSLRASDLSGTFFDSCYFMKSVFDKAYMQGACFRVCTINRCTFAETTIKWSVFNDCIFPYTDLTLANECGGVDLHVPLACPSDGSFVGWKRAALKRQLDDRPTSNDEILVKLLIPEDAKRSSATSHKCRCDKAKVLGFYTITGDEIKDLGPDDHVVSIFDESFEYHVGETVTPVCDFDDNRWEECASGIHFFVDRESAIRY